MDSNSTTQVEPLLRALAAQLQAFGTKTENLEIAVSSVLTQNDILPDTLIRELQSLDQINQGLHDLAKLTQGLANQLTHASLTQDQISLVSSTVRLSSTKSILQGHLQTPEPANVSQSPSDVHLF